MRHADARSVVAVGLALLTVPLTLPAAGAFHSDAPVILQDAVDGAASWGIEVDQATAGDIVIDVHGDTPQTSSQASAGAVFFDGEGNPTFMFALTSHGSPDRTQITPNPLGDDPQPTIVTRGDREALPYDLEIEPETDATSSSCPYLCVGLTTEDAEPGKHHFVAWIGGLSSTELFVRSTGEATATANQGEAYALGDPELDGGTVNVQVQRTHQGETLGIKAMKDVPFETTVDGELYGFWGSTGIKATCPATAVLPVPVCVSPGSELANCSYLMSFYLPGTSCETASLSWEGPGGGQSGGTLYSFEGASAGEYTFSVDRKLDAYGPLVGEPTTGTIVFLTEEFSYLTIADVAVP